MSVTVFVVTSLKMGTNPVPETECC